MIRQLDCFKLALCYVAKYVRSHCCHAFMRLLNMISLCSRSQTKLETLRQKRILQKATNFERERERETYYCKTEKDCLSESIETVTLCLFLQFFFRSLRISLSRFSVAGRSFLLHLNKPTRPIHKFSNCTVRSAILILNRRNIARAGRYGCTSVERASMSARAGGPMWILHARAYMRKVITSYVGPRIQDI